jgi:hypothetical protein
MIQQEELHIKQFTTGVTFYIFSDAIYNDLPESPDEYEGPFLSYVLFDNQNEIYSLNYYSGSTIWTRNDENNYIPIGETGWNYKTGYTIVTTVASNLSQENIDNMTSLMLSRLSDPTRPGTPPSASAATNYVFYRKKLIDDFYVDLKIERSYNSLDTLKINNNLLNNFPEQNSPTGVVFGRLTAIQKIKDENGQNVRIPLQNVPLGVFNPSEDYPDTFSTDDNGDRLTLNIKESATPSDYFDNLSYYTDYDNYLRSAESFSAVPAQYKYITKTNENGEFILYDIPVGQQTVIFEVDLFKQGLTKDEIALNFFPFPPTDQPNIDTLPSFVYKQVPIDVVPTWGLGQTGYTSLDININLDLRKWTTYILPPTTYSSERLNATVSKDPTKSLKVDIRDMTSPGFVRRPIEIVQIPNDLDRDVGAQYLWFNEFSQKKTSIQYTDFGCHVFKLPGNIYDPSGYRTDIDGNLTTKKGVWLAAYQFNVYIDKVFSQRSTGAVSYPTSSGKFIRSHYHLNYVSGNQLPSSVENAPPQIGTFPYEKPWSATYPNKYSIPKKPTQRRVEWGPDRLLYPTSTASSPIYYADEPAYSDGDLVGSPVGGSIGEVGGFGVQYFGNSWFYNRIANVATRTYMYKYEKDVSWSESYANGYEPYWTTANSPYTYTQFPFAQISKVVNGERYQRLECGYGYFLRPEGWLTIARASWAADVPIDTSLLSGYGTAENPGPANISSGVQNGWYYRKPHSLTVYSINNQNFALHLGPTTAIKEGTLDFYRIVKSGPNKDGVFENIAAPESFFIPTFCNLRIEGAFACWSVKITNKGIVPVTIQNPFRGTVRVENPNGSIERYGAGQSFKLDINSSFVTQDTPASLAIYGTSTNPITGQQTQNAGSINTNNFSDYQPFFYDSVSNFRRIDLPSNNYYAGYPIYVRDTVSFTNIKLPGNASVSSDNTNILLSSLYDVEVKYYTRGDSTTASYTNPVTNQTVINGLSIGSQTPRRDALNQSRTFSQDVENYEAINNTSRNSLWNGNSAPGGIFATVTKTFNGSANINGNNTYFIRTDSYGSSNGLVHEGIGKYFYYGNNDYWDRDVNAYEDSVYFYTMSIEGPTSSLWGNFNDASNDGTGYGFGRYAP